ncbi:hypothetical protein HXX02_06285 [Microbulbifer elongatus]|uniref:GTPase n=1 Tax=Microbulbifer elongatus TaxID=86173 RepID=A0ABT1NYT6_9GAMM|nr:hypothetical protein [Microbulbifer elongatus]MCQ3829045.1 hypothetical protein [Microbulbifer elongatus]
MQDAADTERGQQAQPSSEAGPSNNSATAATRHKGAPRITQASPVPPPKLDRETLSCGCRNHRQLKYWLHDYLRENPIEQRAQRNAGTLRSLLAEIARWRAPVRLRLASLEALRPVIASHCGHLARPQLAGSDSNPTNQTQEQRRDLLTAVILYQHLAQAYFSVSGQITAEPHTLLFRRRLARALHRGIDSYCRLIQISSFFFLAPPKGTWIGMQRLVSQARQLDLQQQRVVDPLAGSDLDRSASARRRFQRREKLSQPYLQVALFASANPLQLTAREQQQLWHCCDRWARRAQLQEKAEKSAAALLCSIKLDQPPIPAVRLQRSRVDLRHFSMPQGWPIDLARPLQQLQRSLRRPGALSADMLTQVQGIWAGEKSRASLRTPADIRCQVVIGISAICHHLRQGGEPAATAPAFDTRAGNNLVMEVNSIDFHTGRTRRDYDVSVSDTFGYGSSGTLPNAPSVVRNTGTPRPQQRYTPVHATLVNTSDAGAGLRLPPNAQGRLHSGDLIAVRVKERWEVGMVRWQFGLPDQCRAGVELLGGQTSAVRVHRYTRDGRRTDPMAGLLTGDAGNPPELLLPTPLFQQGDTVDIVSAGQTRTVTLSQQTLRTGSFAIFEFS